MSRRGFRVVVASVSFVAWTGTATAWAQNEPPPEAPPANFGPPPPGHEPPPPYTPGDSTPPVPVDADIAPSFMTLDRVDANTRLGIQVGFSKLDEAALDEAFFMRFNPYGQVIIPGTKVGLYGQMSISRAFVDGADDANGYSNLEMGGFYMPLPRSNDLILRAGLVAATASDDGLAVAANAIGIPERYTDLALALPNTTTGRLSASTVQQFGQVFFRADGGFDFLIDQPSGTTGPNVLFRANAAVGYRIPDAVDLTAELMNIAAVNGDVDGGITERFIHTLGLSIRTPGVNQIHLGTVFPLDEALRGEIWILSAGYQRAWN